MLQPHLVHALTILLQLIFSSEGLRFLWLVTAGSLLADCLPTHALARKDTTWLCGWVYEWREENSLEDINSGLMQPRPHLQSSGVPSK